MADPCCELVYKDVPPVSSLQLYKEEKNHDLIGFHENLIFTVKLHNDLGDVHRTPLKWYCQELRVKVAIISVFKWIDKYWILDCDGMLHQISHNSTDADSADLFDDTTADEGVMCLKNVRQISNSNVVSAAFVPPDFLAVLSYRKENLDLFMTLHRLDTAETPQFLVVNQNVLCKPNELFMEYVDPNDIEKEFVSNWFPHFDQTDPSRGFLFIYNCDGKACCVQLGGELKRNLLILTFADGAVIGLSSSGGKILHFAINQTKCVSYADGLLLSSDYTDCQVTPLDPVGASSLLPIKGVISFCVLDDKKSSFLALTNHGGLYLLKVKLTEGKCQIPAVSSFQETLNNIGYLEELNSRIVAQDSSIKCHATVNNARNFRFQLDLQVVQIMADHHLFRVICESLAADSGTSPVLQAKDWHVIFILSRTIDDRIVHVQQLLRDFSKNQPLEMMVRLKLETTELKDFVVAVKLISFVGEGKYRPTLQLGKVRLNVLSFFEPEYSLLVHSASSSFKTPSVIDLLCKQSLDNLGDQSSAKDAKDLKFVLLIPTKGMGAQLIIEKLLERSRALWRVKPWELNHSNTSFSVIVHNNKISVDIGNGKATVSCSNPGLAILMKYTLTDIIGIPMLKEFEENVLMEAENILQSLEAMELSLEGSTCSEVCDIYKRKVKFLNDSLIGVSTIIE